jgi:3-oxoacyl-[acyl-carrier protein] reductase
MSAPRCALVTGGSRGIGAATARTLACDGWAVGVNFREDADGAERVVAEIRADGGVARAVRADVSRQADIDRAFTELERHFGPVLALVNNAGIRRDDLSLTLSDRAWSGVLETNLTAAFWTVRRALPQMLRQRFGRVVNIASIAGMRGSPGQANYTAAKAGLVALTKTVAVEVAKRGITVNAVAPGLVETQLSANYPPGLLDRIPMGHPGEPEDVAGCVGFLVSERARYITGSVLVVDGGFTA